MSQPNRIYSSSAHIIINNLDWLRKTNGDSIMWIPMFTDYYYAYRAAEQQWWYVDEAKKFKIDEVPEIETIYQGMQKP